MEEIRPCFEVCTEEGEIPVWFGVLCCDGQRAPRLSSDIIEDFCHSWGENQ